MRGTRCIRPFAGPAGRRTGRRRQPCRRHRNPARARLERRATRLRYDASLRFAAAAAGLGPGAGASGQRGAPVFRRQRPAPRLSPAQLARRRTAPAARLRPRPAGRQPVLRHPPALESPPVVQRTLGRAELRRLPLHRHQLPRQRTDRRRRRHPGQRPGDLRRSARRAAPHQRRRRQVRALRRQRPRQRGQPGQPRAAEGRPGQTRGADRHPAEHVRDRPATRPGAPRRHRPVTQPRGNQLRRPPSASEPDRRADQLPGTVAHVADGQAAIQRIRAQRQGPRPQRPGLRPRLPGRRHRRGPGRLRRRGQPSAVRPGGLYIEHPRGQPDPCRGPDPQAQGAGLAEPAVRRPGQRQAGPGQAPLRGELRGLPCRASAATTCKPRSRSARCA